MNILPTKSWHVRNIDNIERVRKDEAKAAEEEQKLQDRAAIAEREARTKLLRARARSRGAIDSVGTEVVPVNATKQVQSVNFFNDLEKQTKEGNKEHEAEAKVAQDAWEKKVGILTHLGQSVIEGEKTLVHGERVTLPEIDPDAKQKDILDPLNLMKRYLGHGSTRADPKKQKLNHERKQEQKEDPVSSEAKETSSSKLAYQSHISKSSRSHSSHKKSSKKKKKKHKHEQRGEKNREVKVPTNIAQLRAERLRRENEEGRRTVRLLSGAPDSQAGDLGTTDARDGRYNAQFHPHLARQRLSKESFRS